jgi:hypothetical protein
MRERVRALVKVRALQKIRALHTDTSGRNFFEAVDCSTNCASAADQGSKCSQCLLGPAL